jgi:hypothetical protein
MKTALKRYGFDDTDPLNTWLNWGMQRFCSEYDWPFLEIFTQPVTVAGNPDVALSSTVVKRTISVKINGDSDPLQRLSLQQYHRTIPDKTQQGHPDRFTMLTANSMKLFYVPDAVYTLDVFARGIEAKLVDATGSDTFDLIPEPLHQLIVTRAAVFGLMAENEEDRANSNLADYQQGLQGAISDYGDKTDGPLFVLQVS